MTKTPRWKLHVEGLGKIREADVEIHPLMLFVGDNDSGKSYLASLLWGLIALQGELAPPAGPLLEACEAWFRAKLSAYPDDEGFALTNEDQILFVKLFADSVEANRSRLVQRVFSSKFPGLSRIVFDAVPADEVLPRIALRRGESGSAHVAFVGDGSHGLASSSLASIAMLVATHLALTKFADSWTHSDMRRPGAPLFLPASRTGFMLLYKAAVRRRFRQLEVLDEQELGVKLTLPTSRFIEMLAVGLTDQIGPYAEEADFLEEALNGRVERTAVAGVGVNDYHYRPGKGEVRLDMSLASSLVTELAPIILVLRHSQDLPVLILEEPEAHLHPRLQRKLAQVIVRLIRKGVYVWITTHSENFCQQINNFMKIGASEDRAKLRTDLQEKLGYSYGEQDYLTTDDIAAYEFINEGDHSVVRQLKKYPDGVVMPSFNKEMVAVTKEVLFLDEQMSEKE
ncbi:MAG: AAA family ATPase [Byssovorax sp.]